MFIVSFRKDLKVKAFEFPQPTFERVSVSQTLLDDEQSGHLAIERDDINIYQEKGLTKIPPLKPIRSRNYTSLTKTKINQKIQAFDYKKDLIIKEEIGNETLIIK